MPRRNRPHSGRPRGDAGDDGEGGGFGGWRTEEWDGEEWAVRPVTGQGGRAYRCPGCDQEIRGGVPHVVAWPAHAGAEDRRHWHSSCWAARSRRGAKVKRSRNGPRY
ncbi:ATP/GTP-binding protein [Mangrovactinospora gilvigrisea]|uniref:ATP/GTP-binding protein n=1 Tax=Mangrovactinospora gilvigrisea TaxID=1428644 RepID=A0A1J7BBB4_9ACTN|nr:ATP/GTP-binding protein [Mangrovactinospora gilvigrisea]OIV35939.1 ATP/GTP-binding protein [Mangrovactinospora gilvigrisea]